MNKILVYIFVVALFVVFASWESKSNAPKDSFPNIVIILADDMGYGDVGCNNPDSKIPTPNIDNLARGGIRFTDAHAPGTTCTPSRNGLLTGRYPFRNKRRYQEGLIEPGRLTVAGLLKRADYSTACFGKWHQGMQDEKNPQPGVDLGGNPTQHGFDYFFGLPASLDIPPYYYVENGQCVSPPSDTIEACNTPGISPIQGAFWRKGGIAPGYKHENVVDELKDKVLGFLGNHFKEKKNPLFLYFTLPSPHTPWLPNEKYRGTTSVGDYGDYTAQVDGVVGSVMQKLKETGQDQNTLVIFTSDNGPVWYPEDVEKYKHNSVGPLNGMKGDVWEGGHRMPFVVNWPEKIKANSQSNQLTSFTDFMATFAELTGQTIPENAGEDSFSFLQNLTGEKSNWPQREYFVINRGNNKTLAISNGEWKFITIPGPGGFSERYFKKNGVIFETPKQLYNLKNDLGEKENLYLKNRSKADEMLRILQEIVGEDRN